MRLAAENRNRILSAFGIAATTAAANENGGTQQLQVQIIGIGDPAEIRDPVPSVQHFGFVSSPVPGAQHVLVFLGGDRTKGVAVGSNDPRYRPTGMKPGESMIYDSLGRQIYLSASGGIVVNAAESDVTVNNATTVSVNAATSIKMTAPNVAINASESVTMDTPLLQVSGNIQDNSGTNAQTMASMRSDYDEHTHTVTTNDGTYTTSTPTPQE